MNKEILEIIKAGMDIEISNDVSVMQDKIVVYFEDGNFATITLK